MGGCLKFGPTVEVCITGHCNLCIGRTRSKIFLHFVCCPRVLATDVFALSVTRVVLLVYIIQPSEFIIIVSEVWSFYACMCIDIAIATYLSFVWQVIPLQAYSSAF